MVNLKKIMLFILLLLVGVIGICISVEYYKFNHDSLDDYIVFTEEQDIDVKESIKIKYDKMESKNCMLSDLYIITDDRAIDSQVRFRYLIFNRKINVFQNTGFIVKNSNDEIIDHIVGCFTQEYFGIEVLSIILNFNVNTYIPYPGEEIKIEIYTSTNVLNVSEQNLTAYSKIKFNFLVE